MLNSLYRSLFDPRGRIDRKGLLLLAVCLFAAQIAVYGGAWLGLYAARAIAVQGFELLSLWVCMVAAIKRLHDIGYGAVWVMIGFGAKCLFALGLVVSVMLVWGLQALETGTSSYWTVVGLTMLPAVAGTLWLHVKPGERRTNRYGMVPGRTGFSEPQHPSAAMTGLEAA